MKVGVQLRGTALMSNTLPKMYTEWLMASYLYYEGYTDLPLTDQQFNSMSKELLDNWDDWEHMHKHLCTEEMLQCQTGYDIDYPIIVKVVAEEWRDE